MAIAGGSPEAPRLKTTVIAPRAEHSATVFFIHVSIVTFSAYSLKSNRFSYRAWASKLIPGFLPCREL